MSSLKIEGMYTGTFMRDNGKAGKVTKMYAPTGSALQERSFFTDGNVKSTGLHTIQQSKEGTFYRSGEVVRSEGKDTLHTPHSYQSESCESITRDEFNAVLGIGSPYLGMQQMMSTMITSSKDDLFKCTSYYENQLVANYKSFGDGRVQTVGGVFGQPFRHAAVYYKQL